MFYILPKNLMFRAKFVYFPKPIIICIFLMVIHVMSAITVHKTLALALIFFLMLVSQVFLILLSVIIHNFQKNWMFLVIFLSEMIVYVPILTVITISVLETILSEIKLEVVIILQLVNHLVLTILIIPITAKVLH